MIIKKTFRFEKLTDWDHEINASVNFFHKKFNVWPNILMANEYALRIINFLANCKQENIRNDDNKTPDKPYVILGSFASENYTLDFCVDGQMPDNSFVLIFDDDPDGGEPIPEEDTELPEEHVHAQDNYRRGNKVPDSIYIRPIAHLDMTPPTSIGSFENIEGEFAILIGLDPEEELTTLLKDATDKFTLFHKISPNTIALNTKWALKARSALKKANLILEIMCENEMSDDEDEFALVRLNPGPGGDGEEVEVQSFLDQIKRVA